MVSGWIYKLISLVIKIFKTINQILRPLTKNNSGINFLKIFDINIFLNNQSNSSRIRSFNIIG